MANFLGVKAPEQLALPVILNVVLIGFSGESGLNVSEAQLRPWFEQLQSTLPHAVMPDSSARAKHQLAVPTSVDYRYHTRMYLLPPDVTGHVEELIRRFLRPESLELGSTLPAGAGKALLQISAPRMNALLSSLLSSLPLSHASIGLHPWG